MYESKYRRCLHSINRQILTYLLRFHRVTIEPYGSAANRQRWPTLVLCLYLYCAATIATNLYFQYSYDIQKKRLKQFQVLANDSYMRQQLLDRYDNLAEYKARSELRICELHDSLKHVGAPHLEWSIAVECVYSYILGASFFSFILWPSYIKWRQLKLPCLEHFLRGPATNERINLKLVRNEMQELIRLSKSHTNAQLDELADRRYSWPIVQLIVRKHQLTCRYLRSIVHSLEYPLNRQPARLHFWARMNVIVFTVMYVYCTACIVQLYLMVQDYYATQNNPAEFDSWRDVATLLSSAWLLFIILNSGALFGIINMLIVMDQIKAITELKRLITELIGRNDRRSLQLQQESVEDLRSKQLIVNIDLDLLKIVMQIRLFDRDFQEARLHYNWLLADYIFFTGGLPLVTRILFVYMDTNLKIFAFYLAIPGLIPMFIAIIPMCYLNSRCLDTYVLLSSLLAQLSGFESTPSLNKALNYEFVVKLLRKQLAISDRFVNKYAMRTFLIDLNYANILRVAFYLSLVLFSILDITPTGEKTMPPSNLSPGYTIFKRIRSDPLGVYQY